MTRKLLAGLLVCAAMPVWANIYKCVDADGRVTYSNIDTKGCKKLDIEGEPSASPAPAVRSKAASAPTPGDFPKVDQATQKARDSDRKTILEQELASEKSALQQSRQELLAQEANGKAAADGKGGDRLQPYRDRVSQHERNVDAISRELANLK